MMVLSSEKSKYRWIYKNNEDPSEELINLCGSKIVARLLLNRDTKKLEAAEKFLIPEKTDLSSPNVFPDMEKAVKRINKAIENNENILIYGDFDADGVTATSLLFKVFKYLGANVSYYIPDRVEEGHGLNKAAILRLVSSKKVKLIITVDCGISNSSEVKLVNNFGVDVIITDHHDSPDEMPPAYAVINPKILDEPKDLAFLAGVGVAYKLAQALLIEHDKFEYLDEVLYLVVIGTIADVVPLLGENRALVTRGLKLMSRKTPLCIKNLLESAGANLNNGIASEMISFVIAPRINAVGRLEKADIAVDLLTSENEEQIDNLVKNLNYCNRNRQQMCESTFLEAELKLKREINLDKDMAIVLGDKNWHPGIIGIVASKLVEKYNKPCFLVSLNDERQEGACSARGVKGIHLQKALSSISDMFERFGGHALAAGCMFDLTKHGFEEFRKRITSVVNNEFKDEFSMPPLFIDTELFYEDINEKTIREIERLEPFGEGNASPVFMMSSLKLVNYKAIGQAKNHLKIFLQDKKENIYDAVWWQRSSLDFNVGDMVKIAFCLKINNFGGKNFIQFEMKDIAFDQLRDSIVCQSEIVADKEENVKWVDHRNKISPEKFFSEYIKTSEEDFVIFAETQESIALCAKDEVLRDKMFDRFNIKQSDNLLIFDIPPDFAVFSKLISSSNPKVIHLVGKNIPDLDSLSLLKKISGMLKYVYLNKNGEVDPALICSKLGITSRVFFALIKTLESSKIIKINFLTMDLFKFDFLGSVDVQKIKLSQEFKELSALLDVVKGFYKNFSVSDLADIKNNIEKLNSDFVKV